MTAHTNDNISVSAAEHLPDPAVWVDSLFKLRWANQAAEDLLGWDREAIEEHDVLSLVHPDDLNMVLTSTETVAGKSVGSLVDLRLRTAHGSWVRVEARGRSVCAPDGDTGYLLVLRDTTDRHGWDLTGDSDELLRTIMEASSTPVVVCNPDGTIRSASAALVRVLGWDRERVLGRQFTELVAATDAATVTSCFEGPLSQRRHVVDVELVDTAAHLYPYRLEVSDLRDDPAVVGFVIFAHDITDLRTALKDLERLATVDPLTGLANRQALLDGLRERLARRRGPLAVLFCDLDGFKAVNDLLGHGRGDEVLCEVAQRLKGAVRPGDLVARLGGDEFVVVCDVAEASAAESLVDRVERAVVGNRGLRRNDREPVVAASVGSVVVTDTHPTAEEVLAEADSEMYRTKAWRQGLEVLPATVPERRRVAAELTSAFESDQIEAYFQPVVETSSGRVVGFETLARWNHPQRGLLGPGQFIAVCEEAGLEGFLAGVMIDQAAKFASNIPDTMGVSVNLSTLQLADPHIVEALTTRFTEEGVALSRVAVEVAERSVVERITKDGRQVTDVLSDLRSAGMCVAIDDFGTGSASLAKLVQVPASILKIDRSLTADVANDPISAALVRAVTTLTEELGYVVVAEGVEDVDQVSALAELGCRFAQGYHYSDVLRADVAAHLANNG